jgi:hypothetical protein
MQNLDLFVASTPPTIDGIDLRCCDVREMLSTVTGARLVISDGPWDYTNTGTVDRGFNGCAAGQYECPSMSDIVDALDASFDCAADDAYHLAWTTWPMLFELMGEIHQQKSAFRWTYKTGGSWHKTGGLGVGFHLRGDSEPFLLFVKGKPHPYTIHIPHPADALDGAKKRKQVSAVSNAYASRRSAHSEKPVPFLIEVIKGLTDPNDLILSVYSGLCPEARACKATSRRMIGAEIDPVRHQTALGLLAGYR